ncbi:MAG: cupin domain-containing protein, partial [Caldilineaceae bacterium]|nr:cupin domain-containing protein [Caldilineaceae bacterium]
MKPSVKPAAHLRVEWLPTMPWNECPRSRGIDAHLPWNAQTTATQGLSAGLKSNVLARLDAPAEPEPAHGRWGVFPGPVMAELKGAPPRWKPLGMGVRQSNLAAGRRGSARLLFIPPGQAVPDHGHNGLELTLVLQGSFSDATGHLGVGDLEISDQDLQHIPTADPGAPCICLAATDAPLR